LNYKVAHVEREQNSTGKSYADKIVPAQNRKDLARAKQRSCPQNGILFFEFVIIQMHICQKAHL